MANTDLAIRKQETQKQQNENLQWLQTGTSDSHTHIQTASTLISEPKVEEGIINTILQMRADNRTPATIETTMQQLNQLKRKVNMLDPIATTAYIKTAKLQNGNPASPQTKANYLSVYANFAKTTGIQWNKPKIRVPETIPMIPTKDQVTTIITASSKKFATIFTLLAETGAECQELYTAERNDISLEAREIRIKGIKQHDSGTYKLKNQTVQMLTAYLAKYTTNRPFPKPPSMNRAWSKARKRASERLQRPELITIQLRNLRNYSGAQMWYDKPDPIIVMRHMRHKKLETTMHYIRAIKLDADPEYITRATTTAKEAQELLDAGFDYKLTTPDGTMLFRKRK